MRAMIATAFGGPEVFKIQDVPEPVCDAHDLVVEVKAFAINPVDWKIRKGALGKERKIPFITGFDVSGVVRGMGSKVHGFKVGDEIYASPALMRDGAAAEFVCIDARTAALKPKFIDHVHAAAMPLVTLTAWEALYERAKIQPHETILIHAGGGGVGHIAIQLAKLRGCRVLTTASRDESIQLCKESGADVIINHAKEDFVKRALDETGGKGCPFIFDCVGGEAFDKSINCLAGEGRLCTIVAVGPKPDFRQMFVKCATLLFEFMGAPVLYGHPETQGHILTEAAKLVDSGKLKIHVSRTFALEELAEAHRLQETGHVTGKLALRV